MTEAEIKRELELYKKMYHTLFNAVTDVIERTDDDIVKHILIKAHQQAEEMYING